MKKSSKQILCLILCAVFCISVLPAINAEEEFDADIYLDAVTDGAELCCNVEIENTSAVDGEVTVATAVYTANNEVKSIEKEKITIKSDAVENITKEISVLYSSVDGEYVKVFFWKGDTMEPLREPLCSTDVPVGPIGESALIDITRDMVFASSEPQGTEGDGEHRVTSAADGDETTYWTARDVTRDNPQSVTAALEYEYKITRVGVMFGKGEERGYVFKVYTSLDGVNYSEVLGETTSEKTNEMQYYDVIGSMAKFVRITVIERTEPDENNWIQIAEIEAFGTIQPVDMGEEAEFYAFDHPAGTRLPNDSNPYIADGWLERRMTEETYPDYTPRVGEKLYVNIDNLPQESGMGVSETALHLYDDVERYSKLGLSVKSYSQQPESVNPAKNAVDGNNDTMWTDDYITDEEPAYLVTDLGGNHCLVGFGIRFGMGSTRTYSFEIAVSEDNVNYTTVVDRRTSESTNNTQKFDIDSTWGRYIKYTFYKRTDADDNGWIRIHEVEAYGSKSYINISDGAGGVMSAKQYTTAPDRGKYTLSFNMFIPSAMENGTETDTFMSGFTLTNTMVSGGADLSGYAAIQVRFEEAGDGTVRLKYINSNQFNEGSRFDFMSQTFEKGRMWDVSIDVDPLARRTDITVTDGINSETRPLYYTYNNAEKTRASHWGSLEAQWILFNTGAGARTEMFVDDFAVIHHEEEPEAPRTVLAEYAMTEEDNGNMFQIPLVDSVAGSFEASLGEQLYAELTEAPAASGIKTGALHLYDAVGRETDAVNGAGGVMAYVDIPVPENLNEYKVEFTMYAPEAGDYSGFSLGSGREDEDCYGVQLRFMNNEYGLQLNRYTGNGFNKGNFDALLGSYENSALRKGTTWKVQLIVNLSNYTCEMILNDTWQTQSRTFDISTSIEKTWMDKRLDTLSFNTGIGGNGEIYVGDIKVTDLGYNSDLKSAANGIVRLQAVEGTGKFLHHQGNSVADFAEKQTPDYTRFVERTGLMDSDGVSFEVMNRPGYFLTIVPGTNNDLQVQKFTNDARFKANATFYKLDGKADPNGFGRSTYAYASYRDTNRYLYNQNNTTVVWKRRSRENTVFYLRSEAQENRISDNFKGTSIDTGKWTPEYPWGDYHNHYGLCSKSAIELKDGIVTLKAIEIDGNAWPKSRDGKDGINLNSYGFGGYKKWQAYVGVLGSKYDKPYRSQCYMEGSFKQPDAGKGFWTAFWLSGANGWPPETDIFEYMSSSGSAGDHGWFTNMHWSGSAQGSWYQGSDVRRTFHTYAMDWGPNYIDMYYDGWCFKRYTGDIVNYQDSKGGMVLIINTGVGGWESQLPSGSDWGRGLSMEWFRSYQY